MDIGTMATMAVAAIAPYLPGLLAKAGEKMAEKAGEEGYEKAKSLVRAILPNGNNDLITLGLAQEVADAPDDADTITALELRVKKLLKTNDALATKIEQLLQDNPQTTESGVTVQVAKGTGIGVVKEGGTVQFTQNFND